MSRKAKKTGTSKSAAAATSSATAAKPGGAVAVVRLLLCVALGVSAYLAWTSLTNGAVPGCGPESDCDRVLNSKWARWFGVPVSLFAVAVDAVALWGTFALFSPRPSARRRGALAGAAAALMILGAGLWFIALQVFSVGICPWCMTAHGAGVVAAGLLLATLGKAGGESMTALKPAAGAAVAALLVLIAGQAAQKAPAGRATRINTTVNNVPSRVEPPATNAVTPAPVTNKPAVAATPPPTNPAPPVAAAPATNAPRQTITPHGLPASAMQRAFSFYQGVFALDVHDAPVIGSPAAPQVIISLFDYSCHHCRLTHPALHEVQHRFSNDLVIVSLPMPLDAKCNATVSRTPRAHTNACEYARLGLAVWRANRAKHREFDDWLMTGTEPPPVAESIARATALVGREPLETALREGWVERQLQFGIAVYELAYRQQHGRMPQIIVGPTVFEGTARVEDLLKLLAEHLGLKPKP